MLLGKDTRGRVQLRYDRRLLTRTQGTAPLDSPALHLRHSGATAVGLGADAHPWIWPPEGATAAG